MKYHNHTLQINPQHRGGRTTRHQKSQDIYGEVHRSYYIGHGTR